MQRNLYPWVRAVLVRLFPKGSVQYVSGNFIFSLWTGGTGGLSFLTGSRSGWGGVIRLFIFQPGEGCVIGLCFLTSPEEFNTEWEPRTG